MIRAYQNAVAGEIARFEGHVAKFMGDGVLAYFGWPRAHEDEAERAVRAGLAVVAAVGAAARRPAASRLAARVGIATGLVVVGDLIGEGAAQEEAVVGETPNLAARLQALAAARHAWSIAEATRRLLGGLFELDDLGPQPAQGLRRAGAGLARASARARSRAASRRCAAALTPLVGREQELGLLLDRWQQARDGEGQVVLLSGEPGIGKSRLVRALRERLGGEPHARAALPVLALPRQQRRSSPSIEQLERAAGFARDDAAERPSSTSWRRCWRAGRDRRPRPRR